mgnify:FL=1
MSCWKCGSGQHLAEIQRYPASPSQIAGVGGTPEVDMNFEDEKPFMELVFVDSDTVGGKQAWIMVESDQRVRQMMSAESYRPPVTAVKAAKKGLSQRKKWGRGGLSPAEAKSQGIDSGVTRARKISSGKVSRHDVRRMSAFNRHRKNNNPSKKMPDGGPTAGTIAWNLWGGTSGVNWAKKKSSAMNAETFEAELDGIELPVCCGDGMELFPYDGDIIITCQGYTQYFGITSRKHHCGQSKRLSQLQDGVLWEDCGYCGGELWDDDDHTFKTTDGLVCLKCYDEHYKEDEEFDTESEDTSGVRCNRCRQGFLQDIPRYEMVNNKPVECDNCRARFEVVSQGTASKLKTTSRRNNYFHAEMEWRDSQ